LKSHLLYEVNMGDKVVKIEKDSEKEKAEMLRKDKKDKEKRGEKEKLEDRVLRLEQQVDFLLNRVR